MINDKIYRHKTGEIASGAEWRELYESLGKNHEFDEKHFDQEEVIDYLTIKKRFEYLKSLMQNRNFSQKEVDIYSEGQIGSEDIYRIASAESIDKYVEDMIVCKKMYKEMYND